jgi:metallophosphoesterase superfamily enzyme
MGHIHPSILLTDTLGTKVNEKCWVRAEFKKKPVLERYPSCPRELIVMPAFNPLLTGTPVNRASNARLGPIFRNGLVDEGSLRIYLLDGTNLGAPPHG